LSRARTARRRASSSTLRSGTFNAGSRAFGAYRDNQVPSGNRATLGNVDLLHHAADRRWDIHRRLLGLERNQRSFRLDLVTGFDEHINDGDVLEVAHIGHSHFDEACSRVHAIAF
jgi:hypothetical protein